MMISYDDLKAIKGSGSPFDKLKPVPSAKLSEVKLAYDTVPQEYIVFLEQIGFGELGDSSYMLYDGLIKPDEIYVECCCISGVLLFGDDFQGFNTGFDVSDWRIVEIDPTSMTTRAIAPDFNSFIRGKIAELT